MHIRIIFYMLIKYIMHDMWRLHHNFSGRSINFVWRGAGNNRIKRCNIRSHESERLLNTHKSWFEIRHLNLSPQLIYRNSMGNFHVLLPLNALAKFKFNFFMVVGVMNFLTCSFFSWKLEKQNKFKGFKALHSCLV